MKDVISRATPEIDEHGNPVLRLPGPDAAAAFDEAAAEALRSKIMLDYLATQYTLFGCWNNSWNDADWFGTGSAGISLQCHTEAWEVSTDGGATWETIDAQVCEYAMA